MTKPPSGKTGRLLQQNEAGQTSTRRTFYDRAECFAQGVSGPLHVGWVMSRHLPWYKRDPNRFRHGTRKLGLSMAERGFYNEILDAQWDAQGPLPKDAKILAMLLGSNPREVRAIMARLVASGRVVETAVGYYDEAMMLDILGVEALPAEPRFEAVSPSTRAPLAAHSRSTGGPVAAQSKPKIAKKRDFSTRDLRGEKGEEEVDIDPPETSLRSVSPPDGGACGQDCAPRQVRRRDCSDAEFAAFAAVFPRARWNGPKAIRPVLSAALASGVSIDEIVAAVKAGNGLETDPSRAPMAETWLRQQRWAAAPRPSGCAPPGGSGGPTGGDLFSAAQPSSPLSQVRPGPRNCRPAVRDFYGIDDMPMEARR